MVKKSACTKLGSCAHDDGNPLIEFHRFASATLAGILSVNGQETDCESNSPEAQVRVFKYLGWIRQHMQSSV